jgi:transposase
MTNYVGLDVSQKTTVLCVVDGEGHRLWRGECTSSPDQILRAVLQHAGRDASIGIETGPITRCRPPPATRRRRRPEQ